MLEKSSTYPKRTIPFEYDWITATTDLSYQHVIDSLARHYSDCDLLNRTPLPGYRQGCRYAIGDENQVSLFRAHDHVQILATGHHAIKLIPLLRSTGKPTNQDKPTQVNPFPYGTIWVSRIDSRLDVEDDNYFDDVIPTIISGANRENKRTDTRGDWFDPGSPQGRTLYVNLTKTRSTLFRIYEKGKQLKTTREWTRLETEYHPQAKGRDKSKKVEALYLSPEEVFTHSKWLNRILKPLMHDVQFSAIKTTPHRMASDHERALLHMTRQYASVIRRYISDFENDSELVADLKVRIEAPF